ncbi:phosphate/phosphite/phosphonate ABC transporter substrate-binding protein [Paraburkholderia acidisoli]|uniref:PhnD/SsuA/transferrin family substrate-binding protein n=1 Tax=Paraburkholderia acidisoli TaxID=2571748 RepID=A0A7Z2GPZ2_9BURK|nr:PhnD/SsuA/transferrin family substrate-binding protein [Paraburkholderia acidisoli]QGZ65733.1 PhnD/SsuA/transferrin family substrate-binding protein [Paraburkholderia acidisoli]
MYNVTPHHTARWRALLHDCVKAFADARGPREVSVIASPEGALLPHWRDANLLLSQTCGFPYRMLGLERDAQLVATPIFEAPGCEGPRYRSVIVVSNAAWRNGATTLEACRGLRAAANSIDSHSGMNALRHAVAPLAQSRPFFSSVTWTGSHAATLRALAAQDADVGAIDCVTLALLRDAGFEPLRHVREIGMTVDAPGLPLIAAKSLDDSDLEALRDALDTAHATSPARARELRLRGFARLTPGAYAEIETLALAAGEQGYPELR